LIEDLLKVFFEKIDPQQQFDLNSVPAETKRIYSDIDPINYVFLIASISHEHTFGIRLYSLDRNLPFSVLTSIKRVERFHSNIAGEKTLLQTPWPKPEYLYRDENTTL
jgi:hypothetical protein